MKQECFFDIKDGSLFLKSNGEKIVLENNIKFSAEKLVGDCPVEKIEFLVSSVCSETTKKDAITIEIPLSVSISDGCYDENLLANFRIFLKKLEERGFWAILALDDKIQTDSTSDIISLISHTARRIKDCACVIGVEIPSDFSAQDTEALIEELSRKHKHYIYFRNGKAQ